MHIERLFAFLGLMIGLCSCGVSEFPRTAPSPTTGAGGLPGGTFDAANQADNGYGQQDVAETSVLSDGNAPTDHQGVPPTGEGVVIDGTMVPKERAVVFLHIGHSNMAGRAQKPANQHSFFYDPDPHLWRYDKGGAWTAAREPLSPDGGTPGFPQGAGPGMALLRNGLARAPDAYFISIGDGESVNFGVSCFAYRSGGLYFDKIMGRALELKGKVTFGGIFTMLSYDARTDAKAQNGGFLACLKALADEYRVQLGDPSIPLVVGDYERGAVGSWSPTCCGAPQVIQQLALVPGTITRSVLVSSTDLTMQDDHHYDMLGHHTWADRAFAAMASQGLLPWATR